MGQWVGILISISVIYKIGWVRAEGSLIAVLVRVCTPFCGTPIRRGLLLLVQELTINGIHARSLSCSSSR